jgi:O-antigen/teichoic acid export membrane protein
MDTTLEKMQPNALRSLSTVSMHKIVQIVGLAVTVVLVPRLFGAEDYGRFAFVLSLSYLGQILGDFGTLDVMGRYVPSLARAEAGRLYMRTIVFKIIVGGLCGVITALVALAWSRWMRLDWAVLTGLGVALHVVAWVPFQFALGLNRIGIWIAEQAWRQWALLLLLLALLPPLGLGGALLAVVLMELLFCGLGLWWVRDFWQTAELRLDWPYLRPLIRFGAGFFLANLAAVALYRSGPALIELLTGGRSAQAGYFNLALGLFLMAYATLGQFAQSLIPTLSGFQANGQREPIQQWLHHFIRYSWLISWLGTISVWLLADWGVPLVFGAEFAPAAGALKWISLGIPLAALLWAGNATATVVGRGKVKFGASLAALLVFLMMAVWLVPGLGATGAALALSLAVFVNTVIIIILLQPDFRLNWPSLAAGTVVSGVCLLLIALYL